MSVTSCREILVPVEDGRRTDLVEAAELVPVEPQLGELEVGLGAQALRGARVIKIWQA